MFNAPWAPVLDPVAARYAPYLRRRKHQGAYTWHRDDILDGCRRLLGICERLARALHLARGLLASGWFHVIDLFTPVRADLLDPAAAARTHASSVELVAEVDSFIDGLSTALREALWCLVNRYDDVTAADWTASAIGRRRQRSAEAVYHQRRKVERALRDFLAPLEETDRILAIEHLYARFAALTDVSADPGEGSGEESSGAAA